MLKIRIISPEEDRQAQIIKETKENRHVLGESPLEEMYDAVKKEYEMGITPLVSPKKTHLRESSLERYSSLLAMYSVEKFGKGKLERNLDGCKSDIIYSLNGNLDKCMGIQVKSTAGLTVSKGNDYWKFGGINKNYTHLLMYFHSITDGRSWLIPYNILRQFYSGSELMISTGTSKRKRKSAVNWNNYSVSLINLGELIYRYYIFSLSQQNILELRSCYEFNIPDAESMKVEQNSYRQILPYLEKMGMKIKRPDLENMAYDFILGELKVQAKTATKDKTTSLRANLHRSLSLPYIITDFGILLIHNPPPYENSIYFIPMNKLEYHNYIKDTKDQKGKIDIFFYPGVVIGGEDTKKEKTTAHNWTLDYLCYLDDPNLIQRLITIYNNQLNNDMTSVVLKNPIFWDKECKNFNDVVLKWNLDRMYCKIESTYTFDLMNKRIAERACYFDKKADNFKLVIGGKGYNTCKADEYDFLYTTVLGYNWFYLFPMQIMINKKLIETAGEIGKKKITINYPGKILKRNLAKWMDDFIFYFNDPTLVEKILALFAKYPGQN